MKKIDKTSKNCYFGTQLHKKRVSMGHIQNEKEIYLVEIAKVEHQLLKTFYFIKMSNAWLI